MKHHIQHEHDFHMIVHDHGNDAEEEFECSKCKIKATRRFIKTIGRIPLGWNSENEDEANTPCEELKLCSLLK